MPPSHFRRKPGARRTILAPADKNAPPLHSGCAVGPGATPWSVSRSSLGAGSGRPLRTRRRRRSPRRQLCGNGRFSHRLGSKKPLSPVPQRGRFPAAGGGEPGRRRARRRSSGSSAPATASAGPRTSSANLCLDNSGNLRRNLRAGRRARELSGAARPSDRRDAVRADAAGCDLRLELR